MDVEPDLHTNKYSSLKEIPKFLSLLNKYNVKATFFVTCDCLEKNPLLFKKIKRAGHELALHGFEHTRFDSLLPQEKEENIKKSLNYFKDYLKIRPKGFRAPQHSLDDETIEILKRNGFKYDSSLSPWNFYHLIFFWKIYVKIKNNFSPMRIHKKNELFEIPINSFIFPFSSLTLRIFPKFLLKLYFNLISLYKNPVFIMHSWDLIEIPSSKLYRLCPKEKFLKKFEFMLAYFSKKRIFLPIRELVPPC